LTYLLDKSDGHEVRSRFVLASASVGVGVGVAVAGIGLFGGDQALASTPAIAAGPARIYAPYFEAYRPGSPAVIARQAGVRFVTLAFAQAAGLYGASACTLDWGGTGSPIGRYRSAARALAARGGGAIISFGGWNADQGGVEIAESCRSASAIAKAYERLVTGFRTGRLSIDLEGATALTDQASIRRRDQAIALTERWAKARGIPLWIQLTLPVEPTGLSKYTLAIVRNAVRNHATINSIGLMVYDYYLFHETRPLPMGTLAIRAATNVHRQLKAIYPKLTSAQLWQKLGFTMMPGIDGYPRDTEVTDVSMARRIMNFARAKEMSYLSIWALQRDNGDCPGVGNDAGCSGISQQPWAFSHLLERFTS
jgi:hypothetical protein